jgi:hypothetical protein
MLLVALSIVALKGNAQVSINLALNTRPQPWLADWASPVNGIMILTYTPGAISDPAIKIRTTVADGAGNPIAVSNINSARVYMLKPGVNQFSMANALQMENLLFVGNYKASIRRSGRLPAGQYQLTIQVTNATGDVVRATQSKFFFVTSYQLPVLMSPANGARLDAHTAQSVIVFRWTPVTPAYAEPVVYRVQVFEVLSGQTPMQAFRANRPLLDEATRGLTQYAWHVNLPMIDSAANRQFIWTVQTTDMHGRILPANADANTQGHSEPAVFNIINQPGVVTNKKEDEDH